MIILNKVKILFVYIFLYGKTNAKIVLDAAAPYGNYNSPSRIVFENTTAENGKQYLNYHMILAEDADQKIGVIFTLEYAANKKRYVKIRTIKEKNACRALNAYGGDPWIDFQKGAGIPPRKCPIKAGNYKAQHVEIDLDKMTFQAIPIGRIRINFTLIHNSDQRPFMSSYIIATRE